MLTDVGGIPVVQTGGYGGCGYGDGCGMGGGWMGMLLVIALLGGRGFGFGGRDGFDGHGGCDCCTKELGLVNDNMNARLNDVQNNIRADQMLTQQQIDNLQTNQFQQILFKEMCDTNAHLADRICNVDKDVLENRYANQVCCCETQKEIDHVGFGLSKEICCATNGLQSQIAESKFENAMIAKNAELAALRCCCETNQHIDQVERNILQKMDCNEIQMLRDKLADVQLGLSQCRQNATLVGELRPCPTPAYITCSPYQTMPYGGYGPGPFAAPFRGEGFRDGCCGCDRF